MAKRCRKDVGDVVDSQQIAFLPLDILAADILSRLPVKSLVRFRCVCKQWCSLLHSHDFFKKQQASPPLGRTAIISRPPLSQLSVYHVGDDTSEIKNSSFCMKFGEGVSYRLSNPVNGLVCAYSDTKCHGCQYLLINPSTRDVVELPRSSPHDMNKLGLAFDASTEEYKLVRLYSISGNEEYIGCEVLTVGNPQWRHVGDFRFKLPQSRTVLLDGSLHWIITNPDQNNAAPLVILVFNLKDEKFRLMPTPKPSENFRTEYADLVEWGGNLCYVETPYWIYHQTACNRFLRIWVLRDYESVEWIKEHESMPRLLTTTHRAIIIGNISHEMMLLRLECFFPNAKGRGIRFLPFVDELKGRKIYSYNLRTGTIQELCRGIFPAFEVFKESLISPRNWVGGYVSSIVKP